MGHRMHRLLSLSLLLSLAGCARPDVRVLHGSATFEGESEHSGIVISSANSGTRSAADGSFDVEVSGSGPWDLIFVASDSVEVSQTLVVADGAEPAVVFHGTGQVRGTVVDDTTGMPLGDALALSARGGARTDDDGVFHLSGVPVGPASIVVSSAGRAPVLRIVEVTRGVVTEAPLSTLTVSMGVTVPSIVGQIVTPTGTPAVAAVVRVSGPNVEQSAVTDGEGRFRFEHVPSGIVTLTATLGASRVTVPALAVLSGVSGLIVEGGLLPLAVHPLELSLGTFVADLLFDTVTPDRQSLLGTVKTARGVSLRAFPLDGGSSRELMTPDELGIWGAHTTAVGSDSNTVIIQLASQEAAAQYVMGSIASPGRHLVADRAVEVEPSKPVPDVRFFLESGGHLQRTPVRFGQPKRELGTVSQLLAIDDAQEWYLDVRNGTPTTLDLDLVHYDGARERLVAGISSAYGLSPDSSRVLVALDQRLVSVSTVTGATVDLAAASACSRAFFMNAQTALCSGESGLLLLDLASGRSRFFGSQIANFGWAPDGSWLAIQRPSSVPGRYTLSVVITSGGGETTLANEVPWFFATSDGRLVFLSDVSPETRRGQLRQFTLTGGDAPLDSEVLELPWAKSEDGKVLLYARGPDRELCARSSASTTPLVLGRLDETTTWLHASISPGGRSLAFDGLSPAPTVMMVASLESGVVRPLARAVTIHAWLADDQVIFEKFPFIDGGGSVPWAGQKGVYRAWIQ